MEGEFEDGFDCGDAGVADLGAQRAGGFEAVWGAGVADEGGDPHGEAGGAQVEAGEELLGEVGFVVGGVGVGEGRDEGAVGLAGGAFAGDAVRSAW
ncbi:hypothetical protein RND61_02675 [Streptomyces sp. TRM76323]|uniref:Uncharacterized protein n=1 Tax=Streptomyces tamarix TaxID=3078565 RepID=A0ABU3QDZ7_9ACTN|nr:hypothetical protein [Streptomyces tamarix]MDT9680994.1 hypothetical protein [Streptomyces tamarix]